MIALEHTISGIILAAGASERMGGPKALLRLPDGRTLLEAQRATLREAGCARVTVVLGKAAEEIRDAHEALEVDWVINEGWESGQFSSIVQGLRHAIASGDSGAIVLPVDAAGVRADTVVSIIETALRNPHLDVIVPEYGERGGHPVYLSRAFGESMVGLDPAGEDSRLDVQIGRAANLMRLPVNDPYVAQNINTAQDWKDFTAKA